MQSQEVAPDRRDTSLIGRTAEQVARVVDRKSFLKKGLLAAVTVTYLDKLASPALAADDDPIYYISEGPTSLTERLGIMAMGCCSGSPACYTIGNPTCGCSNACCYQPAHSGNPCAKRNGGYCWTCSSGTYVCCDYYCYGTGCHCGSYCSQNQCGTGHC